MSHFLGVEGKEHFSSKLQNTVLAFGLWVFNLIACLLALSEAATSKQAWKNKKPHMNNP